MPEAVSPAAYLTDVPSLTVSDLAGAHGYFEVTNADFCKNFTMMWVFIFRHTSAATHRTVPCRDMLSENGLKTPITGASADRYAHVCAAK